jgi:phosphopantothenoylcysteine decarboxylase/phosphopantothenate--cysteine ligase
MAAAVADARPVEQSAEKIKKNSLKNMQLVENPDLLANLALKKSPQQVIVAFAAETADDSHLLASEKMVRKGADLIYLNNVANGAIFGEDQTFGSIIDGEISLEISSPISKIALAHQLINQALLHSNKLG